MMQVSMGNVHQSGYYGERQGIRPRQESENDYASSIYGKVLAYYREQQASNDERRSRFEAELQEIYKRMAWVEKRLEQLEVKIHYSSHCGIRKKLKEKHHVGQWDKNLLHCEVLTTLGNIMSTHFDDGRVNQGLSLLEKFKPS